MAASVLWVLESLQERCSLLSPCPPPGPSQSGLPELLGTCPGPPLLPALSNFSFYFP